MQESKKSKPKDAMMAVTTANRSPNPEHFDPMAEPWWTLPMVASWIIWRTPEAVRNVWSSYRRELHRLYPSDPASGYIPGAMEVFLKGSEEDTAGVVLAGIVVKGDDACANIKQALQKGDVIATGLARTSSASRAEITPAEWNDLDFTSGLDGTWRHDDVGRITELEPRYSQVLISAAEVIAAFPSLGAGLYRTGKAGRPGVEAIVLPELVARHKRGEMLGTVGAEAAYLSKWLSSKQGAPQANTKSMQDVIRKKHKELKSKK